MVLSTKRTCILLLCFWEQFPEATWETVWGFLRSFCIYWQQINGTHIHVQFSSEDGYILSDFIYKLSLLMSPHKIESVVHIFAFIISVSKMRNRSNLFWLMVSENFSLSWWRRHGWGSHSPWVSRSRRQWLCWIRMGKQVAWAVTDEGPTPAIRLHYSGATSYWFLNLPKSVTSWGSVFRYVNMGGDISNPNTNSS